MHWLDLEAVESRIFEERKKQIKGCFVSYAPDRFYGVDEK